MNQEERQFVMYILSHFMIDGVRADLCATEGGIEIVYNIVFRTHKRLQLLCATQYGKSLFVAIACIWVACVQHEVVAIVAPTDDKAKIIMRYFTLHLGDHPSFKTELHKDSKLDKLRMEETKERITMKNGGGIFLISVQAGNSKKGVESAMGAGAKIVIMDEAGLIPDPIESTVFRMIAGKGPDAFYCKIGNPWYRNHFYTSDKDPNYHRIFIDYQRGLAEGRYNEDFIKEARRKPNFDILYECKFPGEDMIDATGYLTLIPESKIIVRPSFGVDTMWIGRKILGIDPSGAGKDKATFCVRDRFKARTVHSLEKTNSKQIAERGILIAKALGIKPEDIVVDALGEGADVGKDIALATQNEPGGAWEVYTVLVGRRPKEEEEYNGRFFRVKPEEVQNPDDKPDQFDDIFLNLRALMFWRTRNWIFAGGQIIDEHVDNSTFKNELGVIKYKHSLQGNKIQLMSKEDMRKLGIPSPNEADALALTHLRDIDEIQSTAAARAQIAAEESDYDPHAAV